MSRRKPRNSNFGLFVALGVVALVAVLSLVAWRSGQNKGTLAVGKPAPDITVTGLDGKLVELSTVQGPVMLTFWQTTCPACQAELETLQGLWTEREKTGASWTVMAINAGEPVEAVKAFMAEHNYTFPAYVDPSGLASETYQIYYIPANFLLDGQHKLQSKTEGPIPGPDLKSRLEGLAK